MPLPFLCITTPLVLHLRKRRATRSANSLLGVLFECLPRPHVFHHLFVFPFSKLVQRKTFPLAQAATKPLRTARVATSRLGLVATRSNTPHTPRLKQWPKRHGRKGMAVHPSSPVVLQGTDQDMPGQRYFPQHLIVPGVAFWRGQSTPSNC